MAPTRITKRKAPLVSDSKLGHSSDASVMDIDEPASKAVAPKAQGHRTTSSVSVMALGFASNIHFFVYLDFC